MNDDAFASLTHELYEAMNNLHKLDSSIDMGPYRAMRAEQQNYALDHKRTLSEYVKVLLTRVTRELENIY